MSLSRSLSKLISTSNPQKWPPLLFRSSSFCTETQAPSPTKRAVRRNLRSSPSSSTSKFPRPSEIPFQAKVANHVHLVGSIGVPVQLQSLPTGVFAVSVLVQGGRKKDSPQLCIPVIFQGDLAQIAACHLKESDLVYVTGQLSGDSLPLRVEDKSKRTVQDTQSHIQVVANSLSFVQKTRPDEGSEVLFDQDDIASDCSDEVEESPSNLHLWGDFFANPHDWWDNRSSKSPTGAAFRHKQSGQKLWINGSTPEWVLSKLDMQSFGQTVSSYSGDVNEPNNTDKSLWSDLVDNPQQWWDNRGDKLKGLINGKYPDFRQKNTKKGLWLDAAPEWVISKLNGLVFCDNNNTTKNEKENRWRNLVDNPNKWWDNRSSKLKPNHPDFKHKDTGEALWLGSSTPSWVLPKLPPMATKQDDLEKPTLQSDTLPF